MAYIETPRTDAGNATLMTNAQNLENFSIENSLLSPLKRKDMRDDLLSQMRNGGGRLKTPRTRVPLGDRRNLPAGPARQEFTPLLQSVTKKNFERNGRLSGQPETPAFLKGSLRHSDSPALPRTEVSAVYGSELGSSVIGGSNGTPMPQIENSSAQSTPLAVLPKRDAAGMLNDQGNLMTLREQENIINKIEKENFGLKLKIHFLEESLRKSGPGFNEAALKENTDLKVDRITLQKELSRCKKLLNQAEKDVEALRRHIEDVQERSKHAQADERLQIELKTLRETLVERENEVEEMRIQVETAEVYSDNVEKMKADIEDLEADLREKERLIDERDDEIDQVRDQARKDAEELEKAEDELEEARKKIDTLEREEGKGAKREEKLEEIEEELREVVAAKERAEVNLNELREEISDKSFASKGLHKQLEEKSNELQDDLNDVRQKYSQLQEDYNDKAREAKRLAEELQDRDQDADIRDLRLKDQNELLRNENESLARKCDFVNNQLDQATKNLQNKSEEKDMLHSRHDALTIESQQLQRDNSKANSLLDTLRQELKEERQHAEENERRLRSEGKETTSRLQKEIGDLEHDLREQESQAAAEKDLWASQRRSLESEKQKAEEQAAGLQRTISKLHETEGTLSGRENQLQEALNSEQQRHESEEAVLQRRVQDLEYEVEEKRQALDDLRSQLSDAREDVRISQRDQADLEEKVQALEDEVEFLQTGLDDDAEKARQEANAAKEQCESLRTHLVEAKEELHQREGGATGTQTLELESRLRDAENDLVKIQGEKQSLQDRLGIIQLDTHRLQSSIAIVEKERDELKVQLGQVHDNFNKTHQLNEEKAELTISKLKLENDVDRLRKDQKSLTEKNAILERKLEMEISRAAEEEARLKDEVANLEQKSLPGPINQDRELAAAKQKIVRLELRIGELENRPLPNDTSGEHAAELSSLQRDLQATRRREGDLLQRENAQKDLVRDQKQKISHLERQLHDAEMARLSATSPKSSVNGSARKSEIMEIRGQLLEAQQHLRDARRKFKEDSKSLQQRLDSNKQNQESLIIREQLEADLSRLEQEQAALQTAKAASTTTITRLRTRISSLENDLRAHRPSTINDNSIAEERKDLHALKESKLEAEDLRLEVASREASIATAAAREKHLRTQIKHVRDERSLQAQRSSALALELENLQVRYAQSVENFSRHQRLWEEERKVMSSRVRFPNNSISELHAVNEKEIEKKHAGELKGLAKQIQWLRAKLQREGGFRESLAYEKKWLLIRIGMYEACNAADLQLLSEMGVNAQSNNNALIRLRLGDGLRGNARGLGEEKKKPSLKALAFAVVAGFRMQKMAGEWAKQRRVREALGKKLEGMGKRRREYVH